MVVGLVIQHGSGLFLYYLDLDHLQHNLWLLNRSLTQRGTTSHITQFTNQKHFSQSTLCHFLLYFFFFNFLFLIIQSSHLFNISSLKLDGREGMAFPATIVILPLGSLFILSGLIVNVIQVIKIQSIIIIFFLYF